VLLLAFDTATPSIGVAVHDGEKVVGQAHGEGAMAHGELLAPAIKSAMAAAGRTMAELTDVAVGVGPGPFTGLRVGVVTALTLSQTLGLRAHGVCTLDTLAAEAAAQVGTDFVAAIDARRKEVYWARYDASGQPLTGPQVDRPAEVAELALPVVGRGAKLYAELLNWQESAPLDPSAAVMAAKVAAGQITTYPLEPLYLRRPDATAQVGIKHA